MHSSVSSTIVLPQALIRAYQIRGHNIANLDPLGINDADLDDSMPPELIANEVLLCGVSDTPLVVTAAYFFLFFLFFFFLFFFFFCPPKCNRFPILSSLPVFSTQGLDMDKEFTLPKTTMIGGGEKALPLREIISRLRTIYCGSVGVEFMFINDRQKCEFIIAVLWPIYLEFMNLCYKCTWIAFFTG